MTIIKAITIWNAIGKRQVMVEGSRKEKPRSIQYEIITPKTMRVPKSEKSVILSVLSFDVSITFNHDHLAATMRFRCLRLPCGYSGSVHAYHTSALYLKLL